MNKKILCLLLALLMLSSVSCGDKTTAETTADTSAAAETEPVDTSVKTNLPADLDFAGASYRIHNLESTSYYDTLIAAEQTGDNLNDAIYNRDQKLMQDMNFVFEETIGNADAHGALVKETKNMIMSGDDAYDMYVLVDWSGYSVAQEGYALPISSIPYVDVSREYWSQSIHTDMSIGGKLYFAFGDHNLSTYDSVNVLLFNKAMALDLDLADHYETVLEGKWTLDLMEEYMHRASYDADGDGAWTEKDRYGITSHSKQILPVFWVASGMRVIEKDEEDIPVFNLASNELFDTMYTRILSMMHNDHLLFMSDGFKDYANNTLFIEGGALYNVVRVAFLHNYRDMDIDYGIIPYPKWDTAQEEYHSRTEGAFIHVYPTTLTQYELAGAVTEAMACASLNDVVPMYYDVVLKNKYTRDENSTAMLDLIYGNRVYDLGDTLFCGTIRDGVFAGKFKQNNTDLQSTISSMTKKVEDTINTYVSAFSAVE
ncbi:MAG: hypothetical protein IJB52_02185 [Clostridia bacterium]|nr:hypothetical protein [Clostridia bacterium]